MSRRQPKDLPLLGRLLRRALDRSRPLDYAWIAGFAAWPLLHAWLVGAHRTTGDGFAGYWGQGNWTLLVLLLPLGVLAFRWIMNRIAPVSSTWPPPSLPAVVGLIESEAGRKAAYETLRGTLLSSRSLIAALLVTAVIQGFDMRALAGFYLARPEVVCGEEADPGAICAEEVVTGDRHELRVGDHSVEKDWSVMFLSRDHRGETPWPFLALCASAYCVQFCMILTGMLLAVLILRHNLFFLARIYQRRWVPAEDQRSYIHVDLDDEDRCFGFRRANDAFNTQVLALGLAAVFILVTRFKNVDLGSGLFPDAGQYLAVIAWLGAFGMIVLPVAVKLLPRLPVPGSKPPPASIIAYLREFLSDEAWDSSNDPSSEEVDAVAARFSENAFWPTGNNRARQLFFFSFWVFFVAVVPDPRALEPFAAYSWSRYVSWAASAGLAWGTTWMVFAFLRGMLAYIDERLVEPPGPSVAPPVESRRRRLAIGVFISYRRSDAAPYAGRLRDSLSNHVDRDRVFMDIDTISGGVDFRDAIEKAIASAQAMLVVIGPQWVQATDEDGQERIRSASDFVRMEVALGLRSEIRVVPVLVGGAAMPSRDELPEDLQGLAGLNAREIDDARWDHDVGRLLEDLGQLDIPRKRGARQPGE